MKTYLNCPYEKRHIAKQHGARWDATMKQWFYEGEALPEELKIFNTPKPASKEKIYYVNACGGLDCGHPYCDDCRRY